MIIKNVKVIGTGTQEDPLRVDLPRYGMRGEIKNRKVDIEVPDNEVEEIGNSGNFRLSKSKIKKKYRGQKWDNDDPLDI